MKRKSSDQELGKEVSTKGYLEKLQDVYDEMGRLLEVNKNGDSALENTEQKKIIEDVLKLCVSQGDFNKALAIFDYVNCMASVSLNDLNLRNPEREGSVAQEALKYNFVEEFTNLILVGESMDFLTEISE